MAREIDHLVLPVHDLDAAAELYRALGFTVTPQNDHPFGTSNRLVQLEGAFLELLSVNDRSRFPEETRGSFNFPAFNDGFLWQREGFSMLVMESTDRDRDLVQLENAGLLCFSPFDFSRVAHLPDGQTATVGFRLGFVDNPDMPDAGFFVCEQLAPQHFWNAEFQTHANGVARLALVVAVSDDPPLQQRFFEAFAETEAKSVDGGIALTTKRSEILVVTAAAFEDRFGHPPATSEPHLAGLAVTTSAFDHAERLIQDAIPDADIGQGRIILPPAACFGTLVVVQAEGS